MNIHEAATSEWKWRIYLIVCVKIGLGAWPGSRDTLNFWPLTTKVTNLKFGMRAPGPEKKIKMGR